MLIKKGIISFNSQLTEPGMSFSKPKLLETGDNFKENR